MNISLDVETLSYTELPFDALFLCLQLYKNYLQRQEEILLDLELALKSHKPFEAMYRDFEKQKVCYLPLNAFLLKPAQRVLHYRLIMERKWN